MSTEPKTFFLIKEKNYQWFIKYALDKEVATHQFPTIEEAAVFMNNLGVEDDEIDLALCDLFAYEHRRAIFNNKKFSNTEAT